jgi:hypothetical protein
MTPITRRNAWSIARFPQEGMLIFTALLWLGFFAVVLVITTLFAIFDEVTHSGWELGTQLPRWFAFGIGIWLTGVYLRVHIAHGETRRGFMRRASVWVIAFAVLLAALTTLGFLLEWIIYRAAGWPQALTRNHLFDTATQVGPILLGYGLGYLVWTVVGALIAAAYRRFSTPGLVAAIPLALLLVGSIEVVTATGYFLPLGIIEFEVAGSVLLALGLGLGGFLVGLATTWALVREMPVSAEAV